MGLSARTSYYEGIPVLHLADELDVSMEDAIRTLFGDVARMGDRVILDLGEVTYVDSSMLGLTLGLDARMTGKGGALAISAPQPAVLRVFRVSGLHTLLNIFESLEDAAQHLSKLGAARG